MTLEVVTALFEASTEILIPSETLRRTESVLVPSYRQFYLERNDFFPAMLTAYVDTNNQRIRIRHCSSWWQLMEGAWEREMWCSFLGDNLILSDPMIGKNLSSFSLSQPIILCKTTPTMRQGRWIRAVVTPLDEKGSHDCRSFEQLRGSDFAIEILQIS